MNILLLGGTGYLASQLIPLLDSLESVEQCVCTQRAITSSNVKGLLSDKISFIQADYENIERCMQRIHFDWIINTVGSYSRGTLFCDSSLESNLMFPIKILNYAALHEVPNYMTIGTALPDDFDVYSFSKALFAECGMFFASKCKINFYNLKLQMFYGPHEPRERFLPMCIEKLYHNEPLLLTAGTQKRDIIYIKDICGVIIHILTMEKYTQNGYLQIPVGTGCESSLREIVEYLKAMMGSESELYFGAVPMRPNEPDCIADTTMLNKLGYNIQYEWKAGLRELIDIEYG
ncbi:MAG: NAD(P)-dependent oxidoreductase [Lachnospiraceae bacterium]|nr:NAD(P)-dependent oxidoreductase [Lachnospiraceae bacterium]